MLKKISAVLFVLMTLTIASVAMAEEVEVPEGVAVDHPPPASTTHYEDDDEIDHFEFTMGFIAGARRFKDESFAYKKGGKGIDGAGSLVDPFAVAPYDYVSTYGLRYDLRLVVSHVRMTVGVDFPFANFQPRDTRGIYQIGDQNREVVVQKIRPYELRFGIGGEYTFKKITPFIDLIGEVDWTNTELSIDGKRVEYSANSFGFSVRGGVRVYLREWFFISAAADVGIVGNRFWDAELSLGFSFG